MKVRYKKQLSLLIDTLEIVLRDDRMALKGGTAINLFHRDLPRYSVDIDLCYLKIEDRATTLHNIHGILLGIKSSLEQSFSLSVSSSRRLDGKQEAKLLISGNNAEIKIEPNYIIRGSLFPPEVKKMSALARSEFERDITARCLNLADTYGGKLCAALDRQHPRDLFDVKLLLENEGITKDIKDSFILHLVSHNRPINELLNPNFIDVSRTYKQEFQGMALREVTLPELLQVRKDVVTKLNKSLDENDRSFLFGFVSNHPDWSLVLDSKIKDFPAVKWKLFNQENMSDKKKNDYVKAVAECLNLK